MREIKFCIGVKNEAGEVSEVILTIDELLDKGLKCEGCEILYKRQFTGLKDINWVEIYEGDIVEDEEHYYHIISWDADDCMFVASDVGAMADLCCPAKVIGNIHQNPELLK